ncbi:uncharacterized protein LY89DRAFT_776095 [Mollisia scopiformis]|uniref:HIG1 domain-containing protein n=1 Tax=Mollisia scopiformis TaxID=149040 RepID=A0A194XUR6_MOLSC|nr:uncharacterized protein LY89DRAFT_776095 [Mollisia scopiformis]KUJ23881.1 hypothetical protein LY89DRAFT_776095 [Mollisia scopiformis]
MSNNPLPSSFDGNSDFYEENRWQKFSRRLKEEPLIPLGCVLTCMALFGASRSIRAGDHNRTNRMFRARIYAQGFTLVAIVAGSMYWQTDRQKRKEFDVAVAERKAKEKNEAWIKELEARDEEEKELRELRRRRAEGRQAIKKEEKILEQVDSGKGASSVVEDEERKKSVLESVQEMVWGKK